MDLSWVLEALGGFSVDDLWAWMVALSAGLFALVAVVHVLDRHVDAP